MTKTCPNCKIENPDNAGFCQDCGTDLKGSTNAVKADKTSGDGVTGFWNKQGTGGKAAIGIGVCCLGLILILAIAGIMSPDKTSNTNSSTTTPAQTTPAQTTPTPAPAAATTYTIAKLYSSPPTVGTKIRVTGQVVQSGDGFVRLENDNLKDIYVSVDGTPSVFEDQNATIEGTYTGPYQYSTAMGSTRTVPGIKGAVV
jgi:hypothetical protein